MNMDEKYPLALPQGTILAGQYVIERVLGQGGFGITYKATDHKTGQSVAVKEFFPDSMATRTTANTVSAFSGERGESFGYGKECFLQEAEMLAKFIGKENIVRVYSYFEENGTAYFVMEFIEGTSFAGYLKEHGGKVSYEEAEKILLPIIEALAAVHAKGIVHRDVTPDNIYITKDGKVKLLDFGAARYSLGDKSRSLDVVLKHGFAPKEQYTRHGRQGAFTDVYTVGASFYFAITGRRPPDSIERMDEDKLVPPSSLGVKIAPEKEDAILTAMSVQAANRYQTMVDFRKALMRAPEAELQNAAQTASMPQPAAMQQGVQPQPVPAPQIAHPQGGMPQGSIPQYVPQPVYVPQKPKDVAVQSPPQHSVMPQSGIQTEAVDSVLKTEPVKAEAVCAESMRIRGGEEKRETREQTEAEEKHGKGILWKLTANRKAVCICAVLALLLVLISVAVIRISSQKVRHDGNSEEIATAGGKASEDFAAGTIGLSGGLQGPFEETEPTVTPEPAPTQEATAVPTQEVTAAPTQEVTAAPTEAPTAAPTQAPTAAPTQAPTAAPTEAPTAAPTEAPTAAPTEAPTAAPTEAPTVAPTEVPTAAPTQAQTAAPTEAPTAAPTQAPTPTPTPEPPPHEHDFYLVEQEPRCESSGYRCYRCDCGEEKDYEYLAPLGHKIPNEEKALNDPIYIFRCGRCMRSIVYQNGVQQN